MSIRLQNDHDGVRNYDAHTGVLQWLSRFEKIREYGELTFRP